jgi:hypothetical protein
MEPTLSASTETFTYNVSEKMMKILFPHLLTRGGDLLLATELSRMLSGPDFGSPVVTVITPGGAQTDWKIVTSAKLNG